MHPAVKIWAACTDDEDAVIFLDHAASGVGDCDLARIHSDASGDRDAISA
jgi:hypothetical protein